MRALRCFAIAAWSMLALAPPPAAAVTLEEIPRPPADGWVVDLLHLLPPPTVDALNQLARRVKRERGAELCVVVVGTAEPPPGDEFALGLFNRWQFGNNRWLNGLMIFVAHEDGEVHVVLGKGITTDAMMHRAGEMIDEVMLPLFEAGKPDEAILAGARAGAERLLGLEAGEGAALSAPEAEPAAPEAEPAAPEAEPAAPEAEPAAEAGPATAEGTTARPPERSNRWLPRVVPTALLVLALAVVAFLAGAVRRRPRPLRCPRCRAPLALLAAEVEDLYLTAAEIDEKKAGRASPALWLCRRCGAVERRPREEKSARGSL